MPIPDRASRQRLAEMGVTVWVRRDHLPGQVPAGESGPTEQSASGFGDELRIRMASGSGDWLLVQQQPWSGRLEQLVADITATIGNERCRFGQWALSDSAGVTLDECSGRNVRQVLSFGPPPREVAAAHLLVVATLDELARDADARRQLWRAMSKRLAA